MTTTDRQTFWQIESLKGMIRGQMGMHASRRNDLVNVLQVERRGKALKRAKETCLFLRVYACECRYFKCIPSPFYLLHFLSLPSSSISHPFSPVHAYVRERCIVIARALSDVGVRTEGSLRSGAPCFLVLFSTVGKSWAPRTQGRR